MKEKVLAVFLLVIVVAFVSGNTLLLDKQIIYTIHAVDELDVGGDNAEDEAKEIYDNYKKKEKYMSVTVNHDDLTCIKDCFVEMVGFLSVGDVQDATVTKSRLISYLEHLRRLSGFNIDAII